MKNRTRRILFIIFAVLSAAMMIFIFARSAKTADESNIESDSVVDAVDPVVRPAVIAYEEKKIENEYAGSDEETVEKVSLIKLTEKYIRSCIVKLVRKTAHFSMYACLGMLLTAAVRLSAKRPKLWVSALIALGIAVVYAISDECHQYFVPGRSMEIGDMLIDSGGALTGCVACMLIIAVVDAIFKWGRRPENRTE